MLITKEQRDDIVKRDEAIRGYLSASKKNFLNPGELEAAGIADVSNDERAQAEIFDFLNDPPKKYFLYVDEKHRLATNWTGKALSMYRVSLGREWRSTFGDVRVHIKFKGINGLIYSGTYYKSSGNYARVTAVKSW